MEATIKDYARMCRAYHCTNCNGCPMWNKMCNLRVMSENELNRVNEIVLNWRKEHPIKTRQSELLKHFPNVLNKNGHVVICPERFDMNFLNSGKCNEYSDCEECKKAYWLTEVDENE